MLNVIIELLISSIFFTSVDSLWLGYLMKNFYDTAIKNVQGTSMGIPNMITGLLAYICVIFGLYYFVLRHVKSMNINHILSYAVPYGLVIYGTFNFTMATVFKGWDIWTSLADISWGTFLCTLTTMLVAWTRYQYLRPDKNDS